MNFFPFFVLNLASAVCPCDYDEDYSQSDDCATNQDAGVEDCSVMVCLSKVATFTVTDCDAAVPDSGQLTAIDLGTETGIRFFAKPDTLTPQTQKTFDPETNITTINETLTGQGRTGVQEMCWMDSHLGKQVAHFVLDNDGMVRVYGMYGSYRLIDYIETPGASIGEFKGVTFILSNTKGKRFQFVNFVAMGFADGPAFMASLL